MFLLFWLAGIGLCLMACSTFPGLSSPEGPEGSPPEMELIRVRELYRELDAVEPAPERSPSPSPSEIVWPGFVKSAKRFVIVGPHYQWAFNVSPLPAGYQALPIPDKLRGKVTSLGYTLSFREATGKVRVSPPVGLEVAYFPGETAGNFTTPVFFINSVPNEAKLGDRITSESWLRRMYRGLFTAFQEERLRAGPPAPSSAPKDIVRVEEDPVHQGLLKFELDALSRGACADEGSARAALSDAMRLRWRRWAYLARQYGGGAELAAWERRQAALEGTAIYVEHRVMSYLPKFRADTLFEDDEYYDEFRSFEDLTPESWCDEIGSPPDNRYWVYLGWAYALALDQVEPGWKRNFFSTPDFFDGAIRKALMAK